MIYIGTAGWTIPAHAAAHFPGGGAHLEQYARQFPGVKINSTFYRDHKPSTFERWAASVPDSCRFSIKISRTITHEQRLVDVGHLLEMFMLQATCPGEKLRVILVQLPPSLSYDNIVAGAFLNSLRQHYAGLVAIEPRHASWFTTSVAQLLTDCGIFRVGAYPAVVPEAGISGADPNLLYLLLHGSPRVYNSRYSDQALESAASTLLNADRRGADAWCVLDNTAGGAAATDAVRLQSLLWRELSKSASRPKF